MNIIREIIKSWANEEGLVNSTEELLLWIKNLNETTHVSIKECSLEDSSFWFYDKQSGEICNHKQAFFSIKGIRWFKDDIPFCEQPIIIQPEIGFLGIICRIINGTLHFLMQAKIEPGNINCVQISPTIQATKSNFIRVHGGKLPAYFELFNNLEKYQVIYDQIQSEQASRFYKKRNRNIIMLVNDEFEILPNFKWMTLGQIKKLMEIDNLVNMDTRTVLSGLPFLCWNIDENEKIELSTFFKDKALFNSIFNSNPMDEISYIYKALNNYKMFCNIKKDIIPLYQLRDWNVDCFSISCKAESDFIVKFYDIEIFGREVLRWTQPLFKARGMATFGLISRVIDGRREFLVKICPEIGSFDLAEIGPSIQWESTHKECNDTDIDLLFRKKMNEKQGFMINVVLSEEGGRFYHEQNYNIIIEIPNRDITELPNGYFWVSYSTLNYLVQVNNCLNIQLRNLLSLIKL